MKKNRGKPAIFVCVMMTSRNLFGVPGSRLYYLAVFWLKVPPRSATGSTSCQLTGPVGQSYDRDHGMIHLDVRTLSGEEFRLRVESSTEPARKCGRWVLGAFF